MTLVYFVGLSASAYAITIALWRYSTFEARTLETYVPLACWAIAPAVPLIPLYTRGVGVHFFPTVLVVLILVDAYVIFGVWRRFVAGKMFRYVEMKDKVCIVTGANTGIGRETAKFLAEMGAHVILACRTESRARDAIAYILKHGRRVEASQLEFMQLDVSSMASVMDFVTAFQSRHQQLDVLINNAGVMLKDHIITKEGLESTMATNHYGHFLLTTSLLPELHKAEAGRVVNVSSSLHKVPSAFTVVDDPLFAKGYSLFPAYAQSKLANVIFTVELHRRLAEQNSRVTTNAVHPGNVQTEVTRNMPWLLYWGQRLFSPLFSLYQKTPPAGAYTSVHVATSPSLQGVGGKYFVNCEATEDVSRLAHDRDLGRRLWEASEQACAAALHRKGGKAGQ